MVATGISSSGPPGPRAPPPQRPRIVTTSPEGGEAAPAAEPVTPSRRKLPNIRFAGDRKPAEMLRSVFSSLQMQPSLGSSSGMSGGEGSDYDPPAPPRKSPASATAAAIPEATSATDKTCAWTSRRRPRLQHMSTQQSVLAEKSGPPEPVSVVVEDVDFDAVFDEPAPSIAHDDDDKDDASTVSDTHSHDSKLFSGGLSHSARSDADGSSLRRRGRHIGSAAWFKHLITDTIWPALKHFGSQTFPEPKKEASYRRETWFSQKYPAMFCAIFLLFDWLVSLGLRSHFQAYDWAMFVGVLGFFTIPLPIMVLFDGTIRFRWVYNTFLFVSVWSWGIFITIDMYICKAFRTDNTCGGNKFLYLMGSMLGLPTLALLCMGQNRYLHLFGMLLSVFLTSFMLFAPEDAPKSTWRDPIIIAIYHAFLLMASYFKEQSERQLFLLRQQLKLQYRAVQAAQIMERKAEESKKRFVSYIFHEVRVPLNTALLAVQNLDGEGVFKNIDEDQADLVHGLMGSLAMMEKVLNDVLSFNRMESGRFSQARKPFEFHKSIQIVALSHRAQAEHANVDFKIDLDPRIDQVGSQFVGDEMRLRQVTSNLVSNALKFTSRGEVRVTTKLILPPPDSNIDNDRSSTIKEIVASSPIREFAPQSPFGRDEPYEEDITGNGPRRHRSFDAEKGSVLLEMRRMSLDPSIHLRRQTPEQDTPLTRQISGGGTALPPTKSRVVVRVEVHDTGAGLRPEDLKNNRLFSPYVQTEIGRRQGGKGSGLGLALVRQIVKLSGGRLGVDSELGVGSTFWFEMPYGMIPRQPGETPDIATPRELLPAIEEPLEGSVQGTPQPPTEPQFTDSPTEQLALSVPTETPLTDRTDPLTVSRDPSPPRDSDDDRPLSTLVVDDDNLTRKLMSRMIKRMGHKVTQAENGQVALDLITANAADPEAKPFEIVFLDNQMPMLSGVEVARELRALGSDIFIVGCTGNALREDQDEYLGAGADHLLTKPIHQESVVEMIAAARERSNAKRRGPFAGGSPGPEEPGPSRSA